MTFLRFNLAAAGLWLLCGSALWAQQPVRMNCGHASQTYVSATGEQWLTDRYATGGDGLYTADAIANTADRYLYATARYGLYGDFEYKIPVANGSYKLTLKFARDPLLEQTRAGVQRNGERAAGAEELRHRRRGGRTGGAR